VATCRRPPSLREAESPFDEPVSRNTAIRTVFAPAGTIAATLSGAAAGAETVSAPGRSARGVVAGRGAMAWPSGVATGAAIAAAVGTGPPPTIDTGEAGRPATGPMLTV
jgi:hypothetical protein